MLSNNMKNCANHFDTIRTNLEDGQNLMMTTIALDQLVTIFEQAAADATSLEKVSIPVQHQLDVRAESSENIIQFALRGHNNDLVR